MVSIYNLLNSINNSISQTGNTIQQRKDNSDKLEFTLHMWPILPYILSIGIVLNVIFLLVLKCVDRNKSVKSPLRLIIILLTVSDIMYLINQLNLWLFMQHRHYHITSVNGLCQLFSFIYYFSEILNECHFILANCLIVKLSRKKNHQTMVELFESLSSHSRFIYTPHVSFKNNNDNNNDEQETVFINSNNLKNTKNELLNPIVIKKCLIKVKNTKTHAKQKKLHISLNMKKDTLNMTDDIVNSKLVLFDKIRTFKINLAKYKKPVGYLDRYDPATYDNYVLNERLIVLFYSFVFMYLLSFLFWIQDLKTIKPEMSLATDLSKSYNICYTYKFARLFFNVFVLSLSLLRLLNVLFNLTIVVFYLAKAYFTYTWIQDLIMDSGYNLRKYNKKFNACVEPDAVFELGVFSLLFIRYKHYLAGLVNRLDAEVTEQVNEIKRHFKHFRYVKFYIVSTCVYSLFVVFNVVYELINIVNSFRMNLLDNVSILLKMYDFSHPLDSKQSIESMLYKLLPSTFTTLPPTGHSQSSNDFTFNFGNVAALLETLGHCLKLILFLLTYRYYICVFRRNSAKL